MTETAGGASVVTAPALAAAITKKLLGNKKPRVKPNHPKTSEMVLTAVKDLRERGGSSLQAIKKYISKNYPVDAEKLNPFIKKYLKSAVTTGALIQTKGKGASGSFKLPTTEKSDAPKKKSPKPLKSPRKAVGKGASVKKPAAKKLKSKPVVKGAKKKVGKPTTVAKSPTKAKVAAKPKKVSAVKKLSPKGKKVPVPKGKKTTPKKK